MDWLFNRKPQPLDVQKSRAEQYYNEEVNACKEHYDEIKSSGKDCDKECDDELTELRNSHEDNIESLACFQIVPLTDKEKKEIESSIENTIDNLDNVLRITKEKCEFEKSCEIILNEVYDEIVETLYDTRMINTHCCYVKKTKPTEFVHLAVYIGTVRFLQSVLYEIDNTLNSNIELKLKLKIELSDAEFVELASALWKNGNLKYDTKKQAIEAIAMAMDINIGYDKFNKTETKNSNRKNGNETMFLDRLKASLKKQEK